MFLSVLQSKTGGRLGEGLHLFMRNKADSWYLRKGCTTKFEDPFTVDGQTRYVDLTALWPDGRTEALEVETEDRERAINNVKKNIAIGFDQITVLTPNRKVRESIQKQVETQIEEAQKSLIRFSAISFYD